MLDPWSLQRSRLKKAAWMGLHERPNLDRAAVIHFTSEEERRAADVLKLKTPSAVVPLGVNENGFQKKIVASPLDVGLI